VKKNNESRWTRLDRVSGTPLRNDARSILRSRPVQALLLGMGVVQGAALLAAGPQAHDKPRASSRLQTAVRDGMALHMSPVVVQAPPRLADAGGAADAIALADQYRATSRVGAIGLTQLMLPTARWFKKSATEADLRDSRTNLRIGFRYLSELRTRYKGDLELALLAFNRGSGTVDRVLERGEDPNNGYVEKVLGRE